MQKHFKRDLKSLEKIFTFIDAFCDQNQIDESVSFTLKLVVEELFTNMVKYNDVSQHAILLELSKQDQNLIIRLTDPDAEAFDITKTKDVKVDKHLQDRKVGGLGIHLVKKFVDQIDYEYENRKSQITLTKHLEK
ncbi:MAG: ATP-binding protein [bacterium]